MPRNVSVHQVLAQAVFSLYTFLPSNPTHPLIITIYVLMTLESDLKPRPFSWLPDPNSQMTNGIFTWIIYKHIKINMSKTELILFLWKSDSIPIPSSSVTNTTHLPYPTPKPRASLMWYLTSPPLSHYRQSMTKFCWYYLSHSPTRSLLSQSLNHPCPSQRLLQELLQNPGLL